jgi:hypothetical protein
MGRPEQIAPLRPAVAQWRCDSGAHRMRSPGPLPPLLLLPAPQLPRRVQLDPPQVEALTSVKTQLPYEYYVLPFCHKGVDLKQQDGNPPFPPPRLAPPSRPRSLGHTALAGAHGAHALPLRTAALNIGEVLHGTRIYETPYTFTVGEVRCPPAAAVVPAPRAPAPGLQGADRGKSRTSRAGSCAARSTTRRRCRLGASGAVPLLPLLQAPPFSLAAAVGERASCLHWWLLPVSVHPLRRRSR